MDRSTELLSAYACGLRFEDLPDAVVHQVKRTLADTLGCALGGFHGEPTQIARDIALAARGEPPARILGTARDSTGDLAAFANGAAIRYLDYNDSYFSPGGGHPSDMIAAILAAADPARCDGRTLITAITVAYEVFCRLSDQVVVSDLGWDQGMLSVLGAVCGAGYVMGLDEAAMGHAISLAGISNLPLGEVRVGELSMWKGCAAASASRAAVFSAQLAGRGMTGPETPLDGRRGLWQQATGGPLEVAPFDNAKDGFRITATIFKHYPSQIHTQGPIGLALELREKFDLDDIANISIRSYGTATASAAAEPAKWAPKTRETADHSIPYLVAFAFVHGAVTPGSFSDAYLQDPAIKHVIEAMSVDEDPAFTARFPAEYNNRMEVASRAGDTVSAELIHPKGHWKNPLGDTEVEAKFRALADPVLPPGGSDRILGHVWSIEDAANLTPLLDDIVLAD